MKVVRVALSVLSLALLAIGYAASQVAYMQGTPQDHAVRVDQPSVSYLSLALLVGAIAFSLIRDGEDREEDS